MRAEGYYTARDDYTSGPVIIGMCGLLAGMSLYEMIQNAGDVVSCVVFALCATTLSGIIGGVTILELMEE